MSPKLAALAVVLALAISPVEAQTPSNDLLRQGQPGLVLVSQPSTLDWAEALLQLRLFYQRYDLVRQQLEKLPETPEMLLLSGLTRPFSPEGMDDLTRCHAQANGPTRYRAAAALARAEAKKGHPIEAMKYLSEALHGAQSVDESWLYFEVAEAASQVHSQVTPDQQDWTSLLLLRQRCRSRQEWFWASRAGMQIFEQLRLDPDWRRTLEYAFAAFDDAEKTGDRLYLWSIVQQFSTSMIGARDEIRPLLAARAVGPGQFAYLMGLHWFAPPTLEFWAQLQSAAQTDLEHYLVSRARIRYQPDRERLSLVHQYESLHREDLTFRSFGEHLEESYYYQKLAQLEPQPEVKARLLWQAWESSAALSPVLRYNLLIQLGRSFESLGKLNDVFRVNLLHYQQMPLQSRPMDTLVRLFASRQQGPSILAGGWEAFLGEAGRAEFCGPLEDYEQELLKNLDRAQFARSLAARYSQLADYYAFQGRTREALEATREQVAHLPDEAFTHRDLGYALAELGQDEEAVRELEHAIKLEDLGQGYSEKVHYLCGQAGSLARLGQFEKAEARLNQAEELARLRGWGQELVDGQRSSLLRAQKRWNELAALLAARAARAEPLARFRLLLSLAEVQQELHQSNQATYEQAELLADGLGGGAPARLFLARASGLEPEARQGLLEKSRRNLLQLAQLVPEKDRRRFLDQPAVAAVLEDKPLVTKASADPFQPLTREEFLHTTNVLRQRNPQLEELLPLSIPTLLEVQPRLGRNQIFLCFTSLSHQVVVLGCNHRQFFARSLFFEHARLLEQIEELRRAVARPGGAYQASSRRLYDNLLHPLEDWTEGKDVWIASHGALFNLPWSALQDQKGHFVVERWHSHRLWWGMSNLVRLPDNLKNALLVAAPGKKQLEGVLSEVEGIGRTLRSSNRLIGPQATRAQLKRRLPSCQWLHLAAHSRLNRTSLNDSFVELSDGPLPLSQLYSLKLAPQTSVVLSSCQTALGQAQPGKDVISLGSGFRLSGAGQVLATLWPVDDQASVHFFQDFYVRLQKHTLVAPALYASSRKLLRSPQWQHLFYWAAYQLEGEMYR